MMNKLCSTTTMLMIISFLPLTANTQNARTSVDEYIIYHSAVKASRLPDASTDHHGIESEPDNVVVTIAIRNTKTGENVYADLKVTTTNLNEQFEVIEMRPTVVNGMVSYTGVVDVTLPVSLELEVAFIPAGESENHRFSFSERFVEN